MTTPSKPRGRPKGLAKTGGRVAGKSRDRGERMLVTSQMAGDILSTYERLGGADFLFRWAKANPSLFVSNVLQKLMPAAPKDDDAGNTFNTQINFNHQDMFEAGRRVAFAMNAAIAAQQELEAPVVERVVPGETYESVPRWIPPADAPSMTEREAFGVDQGEPLPQPTRTPGFEYNENDARDYDTQYRAWLLVRDTRESTIETYRGGSSGEQGGSGRGQPQVITRRTSAREIMNRRNSLL